jgi:RNA polymerase sigma-70 factor (ECF subfamily)
MKTSLAAVRPLVATADVKPMTEKASYALFDEHYARVRAFIRSMVKEDWIAEDLTQDVFMRAYQNLQGLKDPERARPWLFRIAKNRCLDHFRQQGKNVDPGPAPVEPSSLPGSAYQDRDLERQEMTQCVRDHIQLLPEPLRTVLWLFDAEGFTHREIASIMDIDAVNVRVRLHRARNKMREILRENCRFERDERNVFVCVPDGGCSRGHRTRPQYATGVLPTSSG